MSLVESASAFLLKVLPSGAFLRVRNAYLSARTKAAPLIRRLYGTYDTAQLIAEIDARIDDDWQVLMVHSSLNGLAPTYTGNAMELLKALIEYVGPQRTLVMPAFNFGEYGGDGARARLKKEPRFDLRRTPSTMGLLTELFRRSRGVVQSRHPLYRVAALGPLAQELVAGHERAPSGLGPDTPFDYMARCNAQIVGLGKTFQVMTQVHQVEGLLGEDWPAPTRQLAEVPVTVVDRDADVPMVLGGLQQQWDFNIWKLRELLSGQELREWTFHNCPMFAARAGTVTDALVAAARRGFVLYDS
ncbi:MAG: hypothetical protein CME59_06980 [Halioglobus sp.]|nr:hypothetical protein [Halioglobus sp.]